MEGYRDRTGEGEEMVSEGRNEARGREGRKGRTSPCLA